MSVSDGNLFPTFEIRNQIHKFIIYFSAVIYLSSLFFEVKAISAETLQHKSLAILVSGIVVWFILRLIEAFSEYNAEGRTVHKSFYEPYLFWYVFVEAIYVLVTIVLIFV